MKKIKVSRNAQNGFICIGAKLLLHILVQSWSEIGLKWV